MFKSSRAITDGGNEATDTDFSFVNGLTHLDYAFAFVDPTTFKITTMDATTPVRMFTDFAALKAKNPALELFVSIGSPL